MENKKTAIILSVVAVLLFLVAAFVFLYEPARNVFIKPEITKQVEDVTGDLPVLECKFDDDKKAYKNATTQKDVNLCDCVEEEQLKNTCKGSVMDTSFYDNALAQLDETLCEKIYSEIKKKSCHNVVTSSIKKLSDNDPEYLANIYSISHNNEKAIVEFEKLTQEDEDNIDNYIALAFAYAEKGLEEQVSGRNQSSFVIKAFEAVENAKLIDVKNSEVYRAEAYINEIKPDYDQAILLYDKSIELNPDNVMAYAGKGHVERMRGTLNGAVESFMKAAELDIQNVLAPIYTNLCSLEYSRSNQEAAVKNCKIVVQIEDTDILFKSDAYQILAAIFMDNKDFTQAKNYLLEAKILTPQNPNIYSSFSKLNLYVGDYIAAESDARQAIKLSPTQSMSQLALSQALYMQEKYQDSISAAQVGIDLVNDDVSLLSPHKPAVERDLNYLIANNYRELGDVQKQAKYEQKGLDAFNSMDLLITE